jgi:HAD superfamily hydrolase (TIGR01509 family)
LGAKAILFDADGVLVDACEMHYIAFNRALAEKGWSISRLDHETIYNGLPTAKKLERLTREHGFPKDWHAQVHEAKQRYTFDAIAQTLHPDRSKCELLETLNRIGFKVAVCSNSLQTTLEQMLAQVGIKHLFHLILGNGEARRPKPAPDIYLAAASKLGVAIGECLIVEDSPVGLEAARAAMPLGIISVKDPSEVDLTILNRIEPFVAVRAEAA